jgi:sugar-specific transcriptional regulator TrmB
VVEKDIEGKGHFLVHDLSELDRQVAEFSDTIALHRQQFAKIKTTLKVDITAEPKIKFVSGKAGVESLLKEMLWDAEETIYTVWPYHEMLQVFTAETLELFNRRRIKQNIALKSIWTGGKIPARHLWQGADFKVERRLAPKKYYSPMAYSVYGDRVSFISSERELYGFTVHSKEFAALMLCQFSALWSIAKE